MLVQDAAVAEEDGQGAHKATARQGHSSAALKIGDVDLSVPLEDPFFLSVRGLSQAAARIAVHMVRPLHLPMCMPESA